MKSICWVRQNWIISYLTIMVRILGGYFLKWTEIICNFVKQKSVNEYVTPQNLGPNQQSLVSKGPFPRKFNDHLPLDSALGWLCKGLWVPCFISEFSIICLNKSVTPWYMMTLKFHVSAQPKKKTQELFFKNQVRIFKWMLLLRKKTNSLDSKAGIPLGGRWGSRPTL